MSPERPCVDFKNGWWHREIHRAGGDPENSLSTATESLR